MLAEDRVGIVCDAVQSRRMRRTNKEDEEVNTGRGGAEAG